MAWDIYGDTLERGHCEVHPWVHCEYPCPTCIAEQKRNQELKRQENEHYAAIEREHYKEIEQNHIDNLRGIDGDGI
jgi:hypothetical protein